MRLKRLPTLAIAMTSLGGRGARRHPGMAAIAMVATMARAVSASAVNSVSRSWTPAEYSWDTRQTEMHQAVYSPRLGHSHEQQDSAASTYMVILSAIICITLLAIAMVWNGDDDRDEYDARRAHEAQREEVLAQIRDRDNHETWDSSFLHVPTPAYKLLPPSPTPQSPAQQWYLAYYLKWRRETYPDGRPPIWVEEDHPIPQIRAWRAANPEVQLTIRVATTLAPVPLPEWYRALV